MKIFRTTMSSFYPVSDKCLKLYILSHLVEQLGYYYFYFVFTDDHCWSKYFLFASIQAVSFPNAIKVECLTIAIFYSYVICPRWSVIGSVNCYLWTDSWEWMEGSFTACFSSERNKQPPTLRVLREVLVLATLWSGCSLHAEIACGRRTRRPSFLLLIYLQSL